jgi:MFS transporter, FSR family, fosmidomycin resistance protein
LPAAPVRTRRKLLAVGGFAHFVHDGFTDSVYVLLPLWATAFALTHAEVGTLRMVMSGTLAAMQVPAGMLAERYGERVVLALGTLLAGLGFILLGWSGGFLSLAVFLCVAGAGCGTQHPLASSIISRAYPAAGRRAALGTYNFTGDLGKVAAPVAVGAGAAAFGWPASAAGYGVFSIAAGVIVFALLAPQRAETAHRATAPGGAATGSGWGIVDRRGYMALVVIGMIDSSVRGGSLTFLPFLLLAKGAAVETLGIPLGLVFAGGATGKLVCGFVAERVGILRTVILTEAATGALLVAIVFLPLRPTLPLLVLFGIALNGTSSVLYGTIGDFVDGRRQARAYGLFYTLGIGSAALAPVILGVISDLYGVVSALLAIAVTVCAVLPVCPLLRPSLSAAAGQCSPAGADGDDRE